VQLARQMKTLRNDNGRPTFKPEEWRTSKQISSLFSGMKAAQRKKGLQIEEVTEEDIEAAEEEEALRTLRCLVLDDMNNPSHPIIVSGINICERLKNDQVSSLKLKELKDVCQHLHLTTRGSLSRKKTYCEAIENYSKNCTCAPQNADSNKRN